MTVSWEPETEEPARRRGRHPLLVVPLLAALLVAGLEVGGSERVVVEDWSKQPVGQRGIPDEWEGQTWGRPSYDFTIVENDGHRILRLRSRGDSSTISKDIKDKVKLAQTPVLEWRWKVVTLPAGGDSRKKATDDQGAQLYLTWPRFPEAIRSRIIGYVWDTTAPVGTIIRSQKTGTVTYVVVRSGTDGLGTWVTEQRNVVEDFRTIYGEDPDEPRGISISIDSNDTRSSAESFIGTIVFRAP